MYGLWSPPNCKSEICPKKRAWNNLPAFPAPSEIMWCRDPNQVAEGLSEEELKYRMLADSPASDDWLRQEMTMRKRAVQWQYKRKSAAQRPQAREELPPPPPPR